MGGSCRNSGIPSCEKLAAKLSALDKGRLQELLPDGRIIRLPSEGEGIFIGDLHGDFEAIVSIIRQTDFIEAMRRQEKKYLIFLGDYGDRGEKIIATINEVITLKLRFPENVVLLRGNHEERGVAERYGTNGAFAREYGREEGLSLFTLYCNVMGRLPVVAISERGIIGVHGGIPSRDIDSLDALNGENGELRAQEMTWNDPTEIVAARMGSKRGGDVTGFGENAFTDFMKAAHARVMVRSHETCRHGFKLFFKNRLATIFSNGSSRSVSSYYQDAVDHPVFLKIDLGREKNRFMEVDFIEITY